MDGFGPITNTRTLDDAIREAIGRLTSLDATPRSRKLLSEARRYQTLMAGWEGDPPEPEEQFEVIGNVLQLLGTAMRYVEQASKSASPMDDKRTLPGMSPTVDEDPTLELGDPLGIDIEPDDPFASDSAVHRVVDVGLDLDLDPLELATGVTVVEPHLQPWRGLARRAGVRTRLVFEHADGSFHMLVRMDAGAELASHRHKRTETLQVVDGCIALDGEHHGAGTFLVFRHGSVSPAVRSVGESTVLLMSSDRDLVSLP